MDPFVSEEITLRVKKTCWVQNVHAYVLWATEPIVAGVGVKTVFLTYLFLNSKFDIAGDFPNDGTVFPTASKKTIKKLKAKKS